MFKLVALLALCATSATANVVNSASIVKKALTPGGPLGIVSPVERCGGVGTPFNLRISDCDGYCSFRPGTVYDCEKDFMPSTASGSLTLRVEICTSTGFCMIVLETELQNSAVTPGFVYTAKYSIVPNDILSGQTVQFRAYILHTASRLMEICMAADVDILEIVP